MPRTEAQEDPLESSQHLLSAQTAPSARDTISDRTQVVRGYYVRSNFYLFCVTFSVAHACVTIVLSYATAELGNDLSAYGGGILYVVYSLSSLTIAKPTVVYLGPKRALIMSLALMSVYTGAFLFSIYAAAISWPIFLFGSFVGGLAAGVLWTAQGEYFRISAEMFANERGETVSNANASFAGMFAGLYLGCETLFKLSATIFLYGFDAMIPLFCLYFAASIICVVVCTRIDDFGQTGLKLFRREDFYQDMGAVLSLMASERNMRLLTPYQVAFGFLLAFFPYYVDGHIISDEANLGDRLIGLLDALAVFTAAVLAPVYAVIAMRGGRFLVMTFGAVCFCLIGVLVLVFSDETLATWGMIVFLNVLYGAARGVWENTNKAVVADLFASQSNAAFATLGFTSGLAGSVGYFALPSLSRSAMAWGQVVPSILALFGYLIIVRNDARATM